MIRSLNVPRIGGGVNNSQAIVSFLLHVTINTELFAVDSEWHYFLPIQHAQCSGCKCMQAGL